MVLRSLHMEQYTLVQAETPHLFLKTEILFHTTDMTAHEPRYTEAEAW